MIAKPKLKYGAQNTDRVVIFFCSTDGRRKFFRVLYIECDEPILRRALATISGSILSCKKRALLRLNHSLRDDTRNALEIRRTAAHMSARRYNLLILLGAPATSNPSLSAKDPLNLSATYSFHWIGRDNAGLVRCAELIRVFCHAWLL
jgi:hypothetical protein